jgi:hypothetical protein
MDYPALGITNKKYHEQEKIMTDLKPFAYNLILELWQGI